MNNDGMIRDIMRDTGASNGVQEYIKAEAAMMRKRALDCWGCKAKRCHATTVPYYNTTMRSMMLMLQSFTARYN